MRSRNQEASVQGTLSSWTLKFLRAWSSREAGAGSKAFMMRGSEVRAAADSDGVVGFNRVA